MNNLAKENNKMKILDLSLTYHWYDMIASGEKKEEYREFKTFYINRLIDRDKETVGNPFAYKHYDAVRFHRGQGGKVSMLVECKGIRIGRGKPDWGAPEENVFIISLGEIISKD